MRKLSDAKRLAIYLFLITSSFGFLQPFMPLYMDAAHLTKVQIGLVMGLGAGLALVIQPLLGRLSDRLDARRPFISGSALAAALAYLSFPNAHGFPTFVALVAVGTNGTMYLTAAGGVLVGRLVQATQGGAAYANIRVWGSVGYIFTSLLTGWLTSRHGAGATSREVLNGVFRIGPLLFLAIAVIAWTLPDRKSTANSGEVAGKAPLPENLKRFLIAYFLYSVALYGATGFLGLYMKSLGASPMWITGTFAAGVVVEVLVMRQSGRLSDIYGRRPILAIAFLILPLRLLLYVPATGPLWVLVVQTMHGFNFGIMGAVAIVFANDLASDKSRGQSQARLAASGGLASAVGPMLFGQAAQVMGLHLMFVVAAAIAAISAAVFMFGVEDSHPDSQSLADRGPALLRPLLRWFDAPQKRR
ncbi:MFS transporter [Fimbriimonas ginsengisoli]|uniref:Transporter major facilitator family n=1 Tax=Fimbriimonas ginsengisoli Gsoil 348 TaxID=661478 RepID=A0A068NKG8_FIMGI|nr:MFS transporter [Fimbriimonas ginsengisoli]AIE83937.1 transporter major facilitator family [Fimbriimonas ginsengisoli Gsoil 348]